MIRGHRGKEEGVEHPSEEYVPSMFVIKDSFGKKVQKGTELRGWRGWLLLEREGNHVAQSLMSYYSKLPPEQEGSSGYFQ